MAACLCTGACKKTGSCNNMKEDYFFKIAETVSKINPTTYQQVGRKWVKVPLSLN